MLVISIYAVADLVADIKPLAVAIAILLYPDPCLLPEHTLSRWIDLKKEKNGCCESKKAVLSERLEERLGVIRRKMLLLHRAYDPEKEVIFLFCFPALFPAVSSTDQTSNYTATVSIIHDSAEVITLPSRGKSTTEY